MMKRFGMAMVLVVLGACSDANEETIRVDCEGDQIDGCKPPPPPPPGVEPQSGIYIECAAGDSIADETGFCRCPPCEPPPQVQDRPIDQPTVDPEPDADPDVVIDE